MLASGIAELVSLGAVLPFLAVLSEPEMLWQQWPVKAIASRFSWTTPNEIVWPVTIAFAMAALLTALVRLTNLWLNGRLAAAVGSDLSCEAYRRTLYQPYEVHVQRNSSVVISHNHTDWLNCCGIKQPSTANYLLCSSFGINSRISDN